MSYSPTLGSVFNRTKMRDPSHITGFAPSLKVEILKKE